MGEGLIIIIVLVVLILLCWCAIYCFSTPNKNKDVVVVVLQRFQSEEQGKKFRAQVIRPLAQQFQNDLVKLLYTGRIEMTLAGKENFNSVSLYYFPSREICTHILEKITAAERHFSSQFQNEGLSPPSLSSFSNEENINDNQHNEDEEEQMPTMITGKFFPVLPETRIATFLINLIINRLLGSFIRSKKRSITLPVPFGHLSPSSFTTSPSPLSNSSSPSSSYTPQAELPQTLSFNDIDNENDRREEEQNNINNNNDSFTDLYPHILPSSSQINYLLEKAKEKNDRPIYVLNFVEINDNLPNRAGDLEYLKYIMKSSIYSIPRLGGKIIYQGPFLSGNWSHFHIIEFPGGEETLVQFLGDNVYNNAVLNFEKAAVQALSFVSRPDEVSHRSSYSFNRGDHNDEFDV